MAVKDFLKPIIQHKCGIPDVVFNQMRHPLYQKNQQLIRITQESYERTCDFIDKALTGDIPVVSEEAAAEAAGHLIIDAAFMHNWLCQAGIIIGVFPYDHLVDTIMPQQNKIVDDEEMLLQ